MIPSEIMCISVYTSLNPVSLKFTFPYFFFFCFCLPCQVLDVTERVEVEDSDLYDISELS